MVWMDVRAEVGVLKIQRKNRNNEIASGRGCKLGKSLSPYYMLELTSMTRDTFTHSLQQQTIRVVTHRSPSGHPPFPTGHSPPSKLISS